MIGRRRQFTCIAACVGPLLLVGCDQVAGDGEAIVAAATVELPRSATPAWPELADAPLEPHRARSLEFAFETASRLPLDPHRKNRARAQGGVVDAAIELGQFARARRWAEDIPNWRRGVALADLALACVERGDAPMAERLLLLAESAAAEAEDWRRDRTLIRIARVHAALGRLDDAARTASGVAEAERGPLDLRLVDHVDPEELGAFLAAIDRQIATGNFDLVRGALQLCTRLFDRFYPDSVHRAEIEAKIKTSWERLPAASRVELLMSLATSALDHDDHAVARRLVEDVQAIVDAHVWPIEIGIAQQATVAALRHRAGDETRARRDLDAAFARFDLESERIPSFDRATTLRPVAEAYAAVGDRRAALGVYRRAIEEGSINPNSRPRAVDLAATCCSMAVQGIAPDDALLDRQLELRRGLQAPW